MHFPKPIVAKVVVVAGLILGGAVSALADSSLSWATYFGGAAFERAQGIAVDSQGFVYITGNTASNNIPTTPGVFQPAHNGTASDAYIAKLSPAGDQLIWATYLGGTGDERGYDLVVDPQGYVYVSIWTTSSNFPTTPGAYDRTLGSAGEWDVAYVKLTPDGKQLVYSTYVGGSGKDQARNSIAIDSTGALYSSGLTESLDFPTTPGAFQRTHAGGVEDAYLLKLNPSGSALVFSTYFGGSAADSGFTKVNLSADGTVYFGGETYSVDLPVTANAYQRSLKGKMDGFVVRFNSTGSGLIYSTYLGGSEQDNVSPNDSVTIDAQGRAIVIGSTYSNDFPVSANAFQRTHLGAPTSPSAFVSMLSADGSQLLASTLFGGSLPEEGSGIAVDSSGVIYVGGNTGSTDMVTTPNALQRVFLGGAGNVDGFFAKFTPDLSTLLYSTYIGSSGTTGGFGDRVRSVVLGPNNGVYLSGDTNGTDFPITASAYDKSHNGNGDAFVAKFVKSGSVDTTAPAAPSNLR